VSNNTNTTELLDSDPVNGVVSNITVSAGSTIRDIDAGFKALASLTISGHVYYDDNLMDDGYVNGTTAYVPAGLTAVLVDANTGMVVGLDAVDGGGGTNPGIFSFDGNSNTSYYVYITTTPPVLGSFITTPTSVLPNTYIHTGENISDPVIGANPQGSGSDGTPNGITATFTTGVNNVINVDLGVVVGESWHVQ
jgi:hypothetical protein